MRAALRVWWADHFSGFSRREAWGYGVWLCFGVIVAVPEVWAAFWQASAPFPTISATTGELEAAHPWVALGVTALVVVCLYSAVRYPKTRTGVLSRRTPDGAVAGETVRGDQALPYRTPEGGRLTRSTTPVRELGAAAYFAAALLVIGVATAVAATKSDVTGEFAVGRTLYGLLALLWVVVPSALAWPRRFAVDVPFPTLFSTVRSLERRLRPLALLFAAGLVILLIHLVLYPWPAIIPDLARTHREYACHPLPGAPPLTPAQQAACAKLGTAAGRPDPVSP